MVSVGIFAIKMSPKFQMFSQVAISASSPTRSLTFWASQLGLELLSGSPGSTSLRFPGGAALVLVATPSGAPVDHAKAAGFFSIGGPPLHQHWQTIEVENFQGELRFLALQLSYLELRVL